MYANYEGKEDHRGLVQPSPLGFSCCLGDLTGIDVRVCFGLTVLA